MSRPNRTDRAFHVVVEGIKLAWVTLVAVVGGIVTLTPGFAAHGGFMVIAYLAVATLFLMTVAGLWTMLTILRRLPDD